MRRIHFAMALALSAMLQAAIAADTRWPNSRPQHRAVFCGAEGTETSLAYSQALEAELKALTARGLSVEAAVDELRARAKCPLGSQSRTREQEAP